MCRRVLRLATQVTGYPWIVLLRVSLHPPLQHLPQLQTLQQCQLPHPIQIQQGNTGSTDSRLKNISTRGFVGTGDDVLIGGFVIKGTEPKKVLIRALGPSLTSLGVNGALNNPYLYVVNQATGLQVAVNTSWRTPIDSEDISSIIGDAIFEPGDENDAAMILTLDPGDYSAVVADEGGQTGIALIEVNEFDSVEDTRIKNISTRGFVGTGDDVLIGGFVIKGTDPRKVLIRALGPSHQT